VKLTENRDGAFWQSIAEHPDVSPTIFLGGQRMEFADVVGHPRVIPMACQSGGLLFYQLDGLGRVYEFHAMFTPDAWGREAAAAFRASYEEVRSRGADLLVAYEVEGHWRSRAPRSHGWRPAGEFAPTPLGRLRAWTLRMSDWQQSPAYRRMPVCHL
jgi:hypothetical protein